MTGARQCAAAAKRCIPEQHTDRAALLLLPCCGCPGDHLYRMDYKEFVRAHRESGAAITIAALPCDEARASAFGLMKIDSEGRVTEFAEKPTGDALTAMKVDTTVLGVDEQT